MPYAVKTLSQRKARPKDNRPSSHQRGYGRAWQVIRKYILSRNPLCRECERLGLVSLATDVHHIKPLRDGGTHETDNLMPLCHSCHSTITGREKAND